MNTDARKRIERYIAQTPISERDEINYCIRVSEIRALYELMEQDWYHAICMIFSYGRAKGYRAAKAEAKRG